MRFIIIFILFLNCKKDILKTENDLVWQNSFENGLSYSIIPIIYKNLIIYSTFDSTETKHKLVAFDKKTGVKKWEWHNKNNGGIFFENYYYLYNEKLIITILGSYPKEIIVINLENGIEINSIDNFIKDKSIWGNLVGFENNVFSIYSEGDFVNCGLYKNNILTGERTEIFKETHNGWKKYLDKICIYLGKDNLHYLSFITQILPIVGNYNEAVYYLYKICIESNKIISVNIKDLNLKYAARIIYADSNFYYTNAGGFNNRINESDFSVVNDYFLPSNTIIVGYPSVLNNRLFVPGSNEIFCFDVNAPVKENFINYLWKDDGFSITNSFYGQILNSVVYFIGDSKLNAFDVNTGIRLLKKTPPSNSDNFQTDLIAVDPETNYIYTATYKGPVCYKAVR